MNLTTGTDGVTSIPATRTLTSAATDFVALGVRVGDILHIEEPDPTGVDPDHTGDNNRYYVTAVAQHVLTIQKDWPVGSLTALTFRVQRTIQQFSSNPTDYEVVRRTDRDAFRHLFTPRAWWVLDQLNSSNRNIYGESKLLTRVSGADGLTSVPGVRTLTSAQDFVAAGIRNLDNLLIPSGLDAGSYSIVGVAQHVLTIGVNWPRGSLSAQTFSVRGPTHKYNPFAVTVPFYCRVDPPKDLLSKYGMDTPRDALFVMSIPLCDDLGFVPKIGDRFDVVDSERKKQQFEVLTITKEDVYADAQDALHYVGSAMKTRYAVQAIPSDSQVMLDGGTPSTTFVDGVSGGDPTNAPTDGYDGGTP